MKKKFFTNLWLTFHSWSLFATPSKIGVSVIYFEYSSAAISFAVKLSKSGVMTINPFLQISRPHRKVPKLVYEKLVFQNDILTSKRIMLSISN